MGNPLVSVLIPCRNAAPWIEEAIESALQQDDADIEVIVVDDASDDESARKVESFGSRVKLQRFDGRRGAPAARNVAFRLSSGSLIQYLDADDYLLPGKFARQVPRLLEGGLDVVYGDWRHLCESDGSSRLGPVRSLGRRADMLEALLRGEWSPLHSYLYRRTAVERVGLWDQSLPAAQDRDFLMRTAISASRFGYEAHCGAVNRAHRGGSVSTRDRTAWLGAQVAALSRAGQMLEEQGKLTRRYRLALAEGYFHLARLSYDHNRVEEYRRLVGQARSLAPLFRPRRQSYSYRLVSRIAGYPLADWAAKKKRHLFSRGRSVSPCESEGRPSK